MLNKTELKQIASTRLAEARILLRKKNRKHEGAVHLCVCAVEMALKKKICDALDWRGFPENDNEFKGLKSFKTHNPQILLKLAGYEKKIKQDVEMWTNWSILENLNIEVRYAPKGKIGKVRSKEIIDAATKLLRFFKIIK